jgi:hypothetical protein
MYLSKDARMYLLVGLKVYLQPGTRTSFELRYGFSSSLYILWLVCKNHARCLSKLVDTFPSVREPLEKLGHAHDTDLDIWETILYIIALSFTAESEFFF